MMFRCSLDMFDDRRVLKGVKRIASSVNFIETCIKWYHPTYCKESSVC